LRVDEERRANNSEVVAQNGQRIGGKKRPVLARGEDVAVSHHTLSHTVTLLVGAVAMRWGVEICGLRNSGQQVGAALGSYP
jgi:hypothetical protein